jgi:hypothetical protein
MLNNTLYFSLFLVFWITRLHYWNTTFELPFSDMSEFEAVARSILASFEFGIGDFWRSYKSPTLPSLRALQILVLGDTLRGWQIFQAMLCSLGVAWLAREIYLATRTHFLSITLITAVVISKASIFWSLKLSSEGVAESFLYISLAAALSTLRSPSWQRFFYLGVVFTIALLNRPNYLLSVVFFPLFFLVAQFFPQFSNLTIKVTPKKMSLFFLCYACGVAILWAPWMVRSYRIYGEVLPLNTSGNSTFIYGVWDIEIKDRQDRWVSMNYEQIMSEAPKRFQNDLQFSKWCGEAVSNWWRNNWRSFPRMYLRRIVEAIEDRDVQLTKVSRLQIFPGVINLALIDKQPVFIILGMIGISLLPFFSSSALALLTILTLPAWFFALMFQGNPRFLEPMIPLIIWGNVTWILVLGRVFISIFSSRFNFDLWLKRVSLCLKLAYFLFVLGFGAVIYFAPQDQIVSLPVTLTNPGFELLESDGQTASGWQYGGMGQGNASIQKQNPFSGANSIELIVEKGEKALYQDLEDPRSVQGKEFMASTWVYADRPGVTWLAISDGKKWFFSTTNRKYGEWEKLEVRGLASDECSGLRPHLYLKEGRTLVDQWEFSLCGTACVSPTASVQ